MNGERRHYIPMYEVKLIRDGSIQADRRTIRTPEDAFAVLAPYFSGLPNEHFMALFLTTKNGVVGLSCVSTGSLNSSIVHPRELFQRAILSNCASIIVAHNHPSGDPTESPEDCELTKKLVEAGNLLDIRVLDHIIVGESCFVSLREKGFI